MARTPRQVANFGRLSLVGKSEGAGETGPQIGSLGVCMVGTSENTLTPGKVIDRCLCRI